MSEDSLTEEEAKQMDGLMEERVGLIGKVTGLLEMNIVAVKGKAGYKSIWKMDRLRYQIMTIVKNFHL